MLERSLDKCPVHGFYKQLPAEDVLARVDWVIRRGYLAIEYDHRLPLLVFTPAGWAIETETMSDELLDGIDRQLAGGLPLDMSHLKDRDRGLIWRLLEKIEVTGDTRHIPALQAWEQIDYRKVRARIRSVIHSLRGEGMEGTADVMTSDDDV